MKIVITDCDHADVDIEREVLRQEGLGMELLQCKTEDDLIEQCQDADIFINQYAPVTQRVLENLPNLKYVVRYGVGVNNIDVEAATKSGVQVGCIPDYGTNEVADQALTLMLSLLRKPVLMSNAVKSGVWDYRLSVPIRRLNTLTVGIIGLGRIGRSLAGKVHSLGCRILGFDVDEAVFSNPTISFVEKTSFDDLIRRSDVLTIHCPLIKGVTENMINQDVLRRMKPDAYLVNTARGGIINEADLDAALSEGVIAGAALDVMTTESPAPAPLYKHENFIVTPHMSWYSEESAMELKSKVAQEAARFAKSMPIHYPVNHVNGGGQEK